MGHGHQQLVVTNEELVGHPLQHGTSADAAQGRPLGLRGPSGDQHGVDAVRSVDRHGHRSRRRLEGPPGHRVDASPHRGQRRISVRLIPEGTIVGRPPRTGGRLTEGGLPAGQVADFPPIGYPPAEPVSLFGELGGPRSKGE